MTSDFDLDRRFGGLGRLWGPAVSRVRSAHVVVVGLGGVGSWAAEALARSGVGQLTLIDLDHVSESNINRQVQALSQTVGQAKVLAMKERIAQIHPTCEVLTVEDFVEPHNWLALLPANSHAVLDACDQIKAKTAMAAWSRTQKLPFVCVGAAGGKVQAQQVDVADLSQVTHDPLLAVMRNKLRKDHSAPTGGKSMGVNCVFSREAVKQANTNGDATDDVQGDGSLNCSGYGSMVTVTATFGMVAAGWIIEKLAKGS